MSDSITVLIIHESPLIRAGVRSAVGAEHGMDVVGDCGPGEEALALAGCLEPDIVLLGLRWPGGDAFAACSRIRERVHATRVLTISHQVGEEELLLSLGAGARGYLSLDAPPLELVRAIRTVSDGGGHFDWDTARKVIERIQRMSGNRATWAAGSLSTLTDRQREVLALVARGLTNREISERLAITANTVRSHVSRILTKLDLTRRSQAASLAARYGLVDGSCPQE